MTDATLRVNPIACSGHGLCAELVPELISLDEWGYPVIAGQPVTPALARRARRAVSDCPALALRMGPARLSRGGRRPASDPLAILRPLQKKVRGKA